MSDLDGILIEVKVLRSALKHGCARRDILHALFGAVQRRQISEEPRKWLYVGVDRSARPLEIITVTGDDGMEVVIHAMRLRKKYYPKGGRS